MTFNRGSKRQRGSTIVIAMILMLVFLFAVIGIVRSTDTSVLQATATAFRRDLQNQLERGYAAAEANFAGVGPLAGPSTNRINDNLAQNYRASLQPTDAVGIPVALLNTGTFDATHTAPILNSAGIQIRYLIERTCSTNGAASLATCTPAPNGMIDPATGTAQLSYASPETQTATASQGSGSIPPNGILYLMQYRITVRVDGPRGMTAYGQNSFYYLP
jgi:hypothetical protein